MKINKGILSAFLGGFVNSYKVFFKFISAATFPVKVVVTFFGIGYLPEWQDHWSTFFGIVLAIIILHFCVGIDSDLLNITEELFLFSAILCVMSFISIYLFKKKNKDARYEVTIHLVFGQILTIALSIPCVMIFQQKVRAFDTVLCRDFIYCSSWFLNVIIYLPTLLFPYFVFQLANWWKPWPSYVLDKNYNNATGNTLLGFFNAIYATIFMYLISFVLLDLDLVSVIRFYDSLYRDVLSFHTLFF